MECTNCGKKQRTGKGGRIHFVDGLCGRCRSNFKNKAIVDRRLKETGTDRVPAIRLYHVTSLPRT